MYSVIYVPFGVFVKFLILSKPEPILEGDNQKKKKNLVYDTFP